MKVNRKKRTKHLRRNKKGIKFDNLRLLNLHYELALNRLLKHHKDLLNQNSKLYSALKSVTQKIA